MKKQLIKQLEEQYAIYHFEAKDTIRKLDLAKDRNLLCNLEDNKDYQLFKPKIKSIKLERNWEHYCKLNYISNIEGLICSNLWIHFINSITCSYTFAVRLNQCDNEAKYYFNNIRFDPIAPHFENPLNLNIINKAESILNEIGMDIKYTNNLFSLVEEIILDQNLSWGDEDDISFPKQKDM